MEERIAALEAQIAALSQTLEAITKQFLPKVVENIVANKNAIAGIQLEMSKPKATRKRATKAEPASVTPSEDD